MFVLFYSVVVVVVVVVVIDIYLIALWSEKMLDMIAIFLNLLNFGFVTQEVVYPGECSTCTQEEGVFFCF